MEIKEKIDEQNLKKLNIFIAKLLVAGLIFRAVIFFDPNTYFLESTLANFSGQVLAMIGSSAETVGNRIITSDTVFIVSQDCLGWKSIAAFLGLSWASDMKNLKSIVPKAILGITILNIIRIVTTIHLSIIGIIDFNVLHQFLWRWGLTAAVFIFWMYWFKETQRSGE